MIDLTPLDVRKKKGDFRKKPLGGYDPEEVDNFLDLVEERLEGLVKENLSFSERLQLLESRLEMLEGRERAVQDALVSAQELRKEVQDQTLKDAEALEDQSRREIELRRKEAQAEIDGRFLESDGLLRERQRALEELERSRRKFLKAFRSLLERELEAVEVEEARRPLEDVPVDLQLRGWTRKESKVGGDGVPAEEEDSSDESPEGKEPLWLSSLLQKEEGEEEAALEGDSEPVQEDDGDAGDGDGADSGNSDDESEPEPEPESEEDKTD